MSLHPSSLNLNLVGVGFLLLSTACLPNTEGFSVHHSPRSINVKTSTISHGASHLSQTQNRNYVNMKPIVSSTLLLSSDSSDEDDLNDVWSPQLRRVMGTLSAIGMLETAYLTYLKWTSSEPIFCSLQGSCGDVLNGPYGSVGNIPLSAFGCIGKITKNISFSLIWLSAKCYPLLLDLMSLQQSAYASVAILSLFPLISNANKSKISNDDSSNRLALVFVTTSMATFSSFLMSLLFSILHESCPYCYLSAALSISLSLIVWFGGAVEQNNSSKPIAQTGISSAVLTTLASIAFYASIDSVTTQSASAVVDPNMPPGGYPPPTITTKSSPQTLQLAKNLNSLHAKMYGAYWCSHCYDQKEALGKESMELIPYVECSREGKNSQTDLCKEKEVPGYPTWIIQDKLYPGEQTIEELEEIVKSSSIAK